MTTSSRAISALLSLSTSSASKLAAHPLLYFLKDPLLSSSYFPRRRLLLLRPYSTTATSYPLYYELIDHRPPPRRPRRRHPSSVPAASDPCSSSPGAADDVDDPDAAPLEQTMDRSKRKYYRKRRQRMFGGSSDSDDASGGLPGSESGDCEYIELKPEIVDFPRLHAREEELYFYDAFAYPWEKEKHYRMVYQLERKYFPEHSLDKAFVDPGAAEQVKSSGEAAPPGGLGKTRKKRGKSASRSKVKEEDHVEDEQRDEKALIFFDSEKKEDSNTENLAPRGVTEKKVEDFFKCLRKVPNPGDARRATREEEEASEPFLVSRKTELPPRWDGPSGTVVLVNKPKGWTSFTVCGKLRRLVKVQKVGHAGTLDPMATGLLIVCVGKATKLVERYQGMVKGYSGVFRLGEATSTWDADSPVIQREPWEHIKDDDIRRAAASFLGEIWQVPPMFSAIKVGGEKMYEKARRGEMVELSPRRIYIQQFDIERSLDDRQNLIFRVTCSKGTYIRSLCADLGKALGSCAHLTALRRDSIGDYSVNDAWNFEELQEQITKGYF